MPINRSVRTGLGLTVALSLATCATPTEVSQSDMARAAEALKPLKRELLSELTRALKEGGPERAIEICQLRAPEITQLANAAGGVVIGRTSHRVRNPANAPEPWMSRFLSEYLADPNDEEPRAARLTSGEIGYVEPIRMRGICMPCHGDRLEPTVRARLQELYPKDEATGFRTGELRGMFWVKIPAGEPPW